MTKKTLSDCADATHMTVMDLINHLENLDPALEVWYTTGNECDCYRATPNEIRKYTLEDYTLEDPRTGKDIEVCLLGEAP